MATDTYSKGELLPVEQAVECLQLIARVGAGLGALGTLTANRDGGCACGGLAR